MTPDQYFSCACKVRYGRQTTADKAVEAMRAKHGSNLESYQCTYCGEYHIGHARTGNMIQLRLEFAEDGLGR